MSDWDDTAAAMPETIGKAARSRRAYLIVVRGNNAETHPIVGPDMVIGRASGSDLCLDDEGVSRFHCRLRQEANGIVIEDLGSRNGTFCNGERIVSGMRVLAEGDRLQIGTTCVLRFTYVEAALPVTSPPDEQAMRDQLTGTYNRRHFMDRLEREVAISLSTKNPLSLMLVHIDRFAEVWQARSQTIADEVLISAARHIRDNVRKDEIVGRIAVGEFALMMRSTSPGDTFMQAERLRASTAAIKLPVGDGLERITFSIGIAAIGEVRVENERDLLVAAGVALQRAKSLGGDRVVLATQELVQAPRF